MSTLPEGQSPERSGDTPRDFRTELDAFEAAWRGSARPAFERYLPPRDHPKKREWTLELVKLDLEYRLQAGDEAPLVGLYFRLAGVEIRPEDQVELIGLEYQWRWDGGEVGVSRRQYQEIFPKYAHELEERLKPRWDCPHCYKEGIEVAEESVANVSCPRCHGVFSPMSPERGRAVRADKPAPPRSLSAAAGWPDVPGYEILDELGRGGQGVVYKARQLNLQRVVALKMLLEAHEGLERLTRFQREAEMLASLQHPHFVQVFEVGEQQGQPYFATEFVGGGTLAQTLGGQPQPLRQAAVLVETLARAIHAAHQQGLVHRDLKPANVLLTEEGVPKIADFGLARRLDGGGVRTVSGALLGTPSYMAPEQAAGRTAAIGPLSDVYGLGAVLYEMLTGRPPFKGATDFDTLVHVVQREPVPPSDLQPGVTRDLETICLKCLAKEPARRYGSAAELAADLHRYLDDQPILARPPSTWYHLSKFVQRNKTLVAGVLGVMVTLLFGVIGTSVALIQANAETERANGESIRASMERRRAQDAEQEKQRLLAEALDKLAGQHLARAAWSEAGQALDRALAAGHPDVVRLRLQKVKVLFAQGNIAGAKVELESLDAHPLRVEMAGPISLLQGDLALGHDNEAAAAYLNKALAEGLPNQADKAYAQGLLADNAVEARQHLEKAVQLQPLHYRASQMLAFTQFYLGEVRRAREWLEYAKRFFPFDDPLRYLDVLLRAIENNQAPLKQVVEPLAGRLAKGMLARLRLEALSLQEMQHLDRALYQPHLVRLKIFGHLLDNPELAKRKNPSLGFGLLPLSEEEIAAPLFVRKWKQFFPKLGDIILRNQSQQQSFQTIADECTAALRCSPEGTIFFIRGLALLSLTRWAEAVPALEEASRRPALSNCRGPALHYLVFCEWQLRNLTKDAKQKKIHERRAMTFLQMLVEEKRLSEHVGADLHSLHANMAWQASEFHLGRSVLQLLEKRFPQYPGTILMHARIDYFDQHYLRAIKYAQQALKLFPKEKSVEHKDARILLEESKKKLKAAAEKD